MQLGKLWLATTSWYSHTVAASESSRQLRRAGGRWANHALATALRVWLAWRAQVAEASGGRVGYLHMADMEESGYEDFARGFA